MSDESGSCAQPLGLRALDRRLSAWVAAKSRSNAVLRGVSVVLAHAGDGIVWLIIGLVLYAFSATAGRRLVLGVAFAALLTAMVIAGIKYSVRRERPGGIEGAQWSALPKYDLYSFPSGHAARVACIAASLFAAFPTMRVALVLWAMGVCWGRIAVAAHYLSDVMVGALVGILVASLASRLWPALAFSL